MPIVPAHTAPRSRVPAGETRTTDHGTPGWARPQLAWPFRSVRPPQGANAPSADRATSKSSFTT